MTIKYPISTEKQFLYIYLTLYNALLPEQQRLVPSEIDMMIGFALLPNDKFQYQRFSTLAKDTVIRYYDPHLTKININNKLYSLLDKKFLKRDEDKVIYLPPHFLKALQEYRANPSSYQITIQFVPNDSTQDNSNSKSDSTASQ